MEGVMKRKSLLILAFLFLAVMLGGCTPKVKTEEELQADLSGHAGFYKVQPVEITGLEIIKRQTDEKAKKDKVFVKVFAENSDISCEIAYGMDYGLYDSGWILDNVYESTIADKKITPKTGPSRETADADILQETGYAFSFVEESTDLENGASSVWYEYTTEDACAYIKYRLDYRFEEEYATWIKAAGESQVTLLAEPPQAVVDADMQQASELAFTFVEKSVDLENGVCSFWYENTQQEAVRSKYTKYRLDYAFDEESLKWVNVYAGKELFETRWDIEGTWSAIYPEKERWWVESSPTHDVPYELEISNVTLTGYDIKIYRNGELILDEDKEFYIDSKGVTYHYFKVRYQSAPVGNLNFDEKGIYFGDYFTMNAVFERKN